MSLARVYLGHPPRFNGSYGGGVCSQVRPIATETVLGTSLLGISYLHHSRGEMAAIPKSLLARPSFACTLFWSAT